ncbi:MAG: tRNA pseudouridine(38-40) synthase TruA [Blastocatellia bacterium]|nr:tRNA pseudouridine(38-40) synthase TruA [Chloracidobacterium sp.]MBL8185434.1 tRNA pseudouridine(38-40) synthase TruA [Blastocatellia bacterium]HBE83915.1 tRNA pseudouridine(38-40) synthase TruA [Blastocatellia bacterium]HRJ89367.1 tRNA pseudouridine(38-40) synthase TruA [Pyrinomonadaceae bacterium]HRK48838.1 tRNA pseudouridine(38-40) synthase TruA [Pyrinomonadaceae bacterium]
MNYRFLIQYDGTDFHGWQVQENDRTIQGELERVIGTLEDAPVKVVGSGRTDAGVHAEGQVANVNMNRRFTPDRLRAAINGNLWRDIRIMNVELAPDDFHARFSARNKTYLYRIVNAPVMTPFWRRFAHHESRPLDIGRMTAASRMLLGEHDWTAFSSAQADGENRVRTVTDCTIQTVWDPRARASMIEFSISANGFLRYMVRSIIGTIIEIGRGEKDSDTIQTAIVTGDRSLAGKTAPAHGLTLMKVEY